MERIALVTGGARRIGAAIVRELHGAGAKVIIHCHRSRDEAEALALELNAARADSAAVEQVDLREPGVPAQLVERAAARWGGLDLLVNNASTFYPTEVGTVTEQHWHDLVDTNLKAPFFLAQAAAPSLRERRGSIVNIGDVHALRPMKGHPVYSSAKAGLTMMTGALARELGPEVRVNCVAPGAILWPEVRMPDDVKEHIVEATALKRTGTPEDIAGMVRFLAFETDYVTGQVIAVDGGRSIGWT